MILKFFGGAQEVGRSSILLKDGKSLMMDFGIKIDGKTDYPIDTPQIDALILSHAHLDHSGACPLHYELAHPPIFGTKPTLELSMLLLEDALSIARKEHLKSRYHKRQVQLLKNNFINMYYHRPVEFDKFRLSMYDAGHISGSAITLIERPGRENRRIVYTGDMKLEPQSLHRGAEIVKGDVLITEATYGDKDHPDRKEEIAKFIDEIIEVLDNGGNALVPSFAVGRAQELLTILHENGLSGSVYLDGMARTATKIVARNPSFISNSETLSDAIEDAELIVDRRDRASVLDGPSIIVSTAGMLQGGPALSYIRKLNKNSKIFITGYQAEGTNGRSLVENGHINTENGKIRIETPVSVYDFSAHAGRDGLMRYVKESGASTIICVHADSDIEKSFVSDLKGMGFDARAPQVGDTIKLED